MTSQINKNRLRAARRREERNAKRALAWVLTRQALAGGAVRRRELIANVKQMDSLDFAKCLTRFIRFGLVYTVFRRWCILTAKGRLTP